MQMLMLGAHMSIAGGVSNAIERAQSVGSNAVQVFTKNNRQWQGPAVNLEDVSIWQEALPDSGIAYAVSHASYLINLASPKDELWEKSLNAHKDELQRAHAYRIPHVVLHPGAHVKSGADAGIERTAAALNRVHAETPECADTLTLLELMAGQGTTIGRNFDELRRVIDRVDDDARVGVCLDTCHAFAAGYDLRDEAGYETMMREIDDVLGRDRIGCLHFNDSKGALGSHLDRHVHIGQGEIGAEGFRLILNDPRWEGIAMLLETPKKEDLKDDVENLARLCALVEDPARLPAGLRSSL